ncbi:MAG TPA: IS481 family transposase [Nitrososphaeraceae archaeon]|nr:IS481 family transposase [Nitrososphaeraceae archaeon]
MRKKEWTGETVTNICARYQVSRKSYYKWKDRYLENGINGLQDKSRKPYNIQPRKVTKELEQEILDLRITKRFGCNRIRFRLKRLKEISFSTKTIYKILKRHGLNILECKIKNRKWKRFAMKKLNQMVQMDILGPFYLENSAQKNYFISCEDDCSRKVTSEWSERKKSIDVLDLLEDYIVENGKPNKVMHDNGKQFTSKIFRRFLQRNNIKDKSIPAGYPQLQGKIEAYNKIVKNEFLAVENIFDVEEGKKMYSMFVKAYNEEREHGGINGYTPSQMFLSKGRLNSCNNNKIVKQIKESVTHVGK